MPSATAKGLHPLVHPDKTLLVQINYISTKISPDHISLILVEILQHNDKVMIEESFIDFIQSHEKTGEGLTTEILNKLKADKLHIVSTSVVIPEGRKERIHARVSVKRSLIMTSFVRRSQGYKLEIWHCCQLKYSER